MSRRWRDLGAGVLVTVLIFAFAEFYSRRRLSDPDEFRRLALKLFYTPHDQPVSGGLFELNRRLFWRFEPGFKMEFKETKTGRDFPFEVDADGFRREVVTGGGQEPFLLVGFGDSCSAGLEVARSYTHHLAQLVKAGRPSLNVRVRNAATSGYTSEQGLRQVRDFVSGGGRADLALLHFGHNDITPAFEDIPDKNLNQTVFYKLRLRKFLTHSYFAVLLFEWMQARNPSLLWPQAKNARVGIQDFAFNVREMIRLLKGAGARVALLDSIKVLPEPGYQPPDEIVEVARQLREYNQVMKTVAAAEGAVYVDIWPLAVQKGNAAFFNDPAHDTVHPGPEGHRWIAEEIYKDLRLPRAAPAGS